MFYYLCGINPQQLSYQIILQTKQLQFTEEHIVHSVQLYRLIQMQSEPSYKIKLSSPSWLQFSQWLCRNDLQLHFQENLMTLCCFQDERLLLTGQKTWLCTWSIYSTATLCNAPTTLLVWWKCCMFSSFVEQVHWKKIFILVIYIFFNSVFLYPVSALAFSKDYSFWKEQPLRKC